MYKKGAGNDKQGKDAGNRTLCPYRNFSQAIMLGTAHKGGNVSIVNTYLINFSFPNILDMCALSCLVFQYYYDVESLMQNCDKKGFVNHTQQ